MSRNIEYMAHRFWVAYTTALIIAALGCVPDNNQTESTDVEGAVGGDSLDVKSATADYTGDSYVVSLGDTVELECTASSGLPMSYQVVRIFGVNGAGTYDAAESVAFDSFVQGVSETEMATSGTVTIESIGFRTISGQVEARGPESEIRGTFAAEICD